MKAIILCAVGIAIVLLTACNGRIENASSSAPGTHAAVDLKFHTAFQPEFELLKWDEGKRLIFLPVSSNKGRYPGFNAPVNQMAGKVGRVVSCKRDSGGYKTVRVQMEDSGKVFQGYEGNGLSDYYVSLDDQAISAENYERARTLVGKTLWVKNTGPDPYDETTNSRRADYSISTPGKLEPVRVVGVSLSDEHLAPVRLIVTWNGTKYFKDVNYDSPSIDQQYWHLYRLEDLFLDVDPLSLHWPTETIQAIKERRIVIGMTSDQVLLSWGEPEKKNQTVTASGTSEQWVYRGNQYAYIDNGILTSIQGEN